MGYIGKTPMHCQTKQFQYRDCDLSRIGPKAWEQRRRTPTMSVEKIETLIVGGGQAGLAMSEHLSRRGMPHLIVERHRIAERWRSERWTLWLPMVRLGMIDFPIGRSRTSIP